MFKMFDYQKEIVSGLINQDFHSSEVKEEAKIDFVNLFSNEMVIEIFSHLNVAELGRCCLISKTWTVLASDERLWDAVTLKTITFGKNQWGKYFGEIGKELPLPKDIDEILKSPCPFFQGKKVRETHMLVLIPETVNGKPLDLITLEELVKAPKEGSATKYISIWDTIIQVYGHQAVIQFHWALMTKDVIPGSRGMSYPEQQALITEFAKKTGINYGVPNVLDAAICIFMHHAGFGKYLFSLKPLTYTRCVEHVNTYQIAVGGFSPAGLVFYYSLFDNDDIGVAALRKFF